MVSMMAFKNEAQPFDWASASVEEQVSYARSLGDAELRSVARDFTWNAQSAPVLGWIMAQRSIDLGTALSVFLNGQPARLNYLAKRDVPEDLRNEAQVLDTICLRLNSGFYLLYPDQDVADRAEITEWMERQARDRLIGRQGRFILDETIIATLLNNELRMTREKETPDYGEGTSILRDLFSPVLELGVSRQILRYHPPKEDPDSDLSKLKY